MSKQKQRVGRASTPAASGVERRLRKLERRLDSALARAQKRRRQLDEAVLELRALIAEAVALVGGSEDPSVADARVALARSDAALAALIGEAGASPTADSTTVETGVPEPGPEAEPEPGPEAEAEPGPPGEVARAPEPDPEPGREPDAAFETAPGSEPEAEPVSGEVAPVPEPGGVSRPWQPPGDPELAWRPDAAPPVETGDAVGAGGDVPRAGQPAGDPAADAPAEPAEPLGDDGPDRPAAGGD
jgi:hypothetical protein